MNFPPVFFAFPLLASFSAGEIIREFDAARHNRFVNFPSDLTLNETFLHADEDLSGVGWRTVDTRRHFTLISPKHIVGAAHFSAGVGSQVRFVNPAGEVKTYSVIAQQSLLNDEEPARNSDLFIAELSESIPASDGISAMPVLNLAAEAAYVGLDLVVTGRLSRAGIGEISNFLDFGADPLTAGAGINPTRAFTFLFSTPDLQANGDDARLESGDSGSPSLTMTPDGFALVGNHLAVAENSTLLTTTYTNFDTFVPHFIEALDEVMEEAGYHVIRANATNPDLSLEFGKGADTVLSSGRTTFEVVVSNEGDAEIAHNLMLSLGVTGGTVASLTSEDWVLPTDASGVTALRGGLEAGESITLSVELDLPEDPVGPVMVSATMSADGSDDLAATESRDVLRSFQDWAAGLEDPSPEGDPDGDGLSNELEYALGRDGGVREGTEPFVFSLTDDVVSYSFQGRRFLSAAGRSVSLLTSLDLVEWTGIDEEDFLVEVLNYQTESFSGELASEEPTRFFQLQVDTSEGNQVTPGL